MDFLRRLIDLMLFRQGPEDMPGDQQSLILSIAAYAILQSIQVLLVVPVAGALIQAGLATVLLAVYIKAILRFRELPNRFNQTATALYASGAVLTLIMLAPTNALQPYIEELAQASDPAEVETPSPLFALGYLLIGIWGLAISSFVYHRALDVSKVMGVVTAIGFELLLLLVFSVLG